MNGIDIDETLVRVETKSTQCCWNSNPNNWGLPSGLLGVTAASMCPGHWLRPWPDQASLNIHSPQLDQTSEIFLPDSRPWPPFLIYFQQRNTQIVLTVGGKTSRWKGLFSKNSRRIQGTRSPGSAHIPTSAKAWGNWSWLLRRDPPPVCECYQLQSNWEVFMENILCDLLFTIDLLLTREDISPFSCVITPSG